MSYHGQGMADVTTGDTGTRLNTAAEIYEGRVVVCK